MPSRWAWRPSRSRYAATAASPRWSEPWPPRSRSPTWPAPSSTGAVARLGARRGDGRCSASAHLVALVDARTPLLVADTQGVRIRLGPDLARAPVGRPRVSVEHLPRRGLLRDGRLVLVVHNPERLIEELDRAGRRQSRIARKLYGAPFAVPLALSTRVTGAGGRPDRRPGPARGRPAPSWSRSHRGAGAEDRSRGGVETELPPVAEAPEPTPEDEPAGTETDADAPPVRAGTTRAPCSPRHRRHRRSPPAERPRPRRRAAAEPVGPLPMVASATPSPLRDPVTAQRSEVDAT